MPRVSDREPRAPRIALDLERPQVAADVFIDQAVHEGLRLEGFRFAGVEAEQVGLKRFVLTEVDLSEAKLDRLDLEDGAINGCNMASLTSYSCTLERVVIEASRLTGAVLIQPRLVDVVFRDAPIDLSCFRFGRLNRVRFERCRLVEADFQGVTANACTFIDCDLTSAQLSQGTFAGSAFRGCRLAGLRGLEALKGARMAWEDVMELATALATSLGIDVRDDIS
ncbi:MAG TPA: pentapeptide repeat-containing protein [Solirubrobacteraceae bacterium]|nr:pentapeptide repeat-containing protein [Solirubrobacteraceae bacterium]